MDESKRQLWEERFEEQVNSGMTVDAWCTQNQIASYTFYYWKQRIRKAKMEPMEKETEAPLFACSSKRSSQSCLFDSSIVS